MLVKYECECDLSVIFMTTDKVIELCDDPVVRVRSTNPIPATIASMVIAVVFQFIGLGSGQLNHVVLKPGFMDCYLYASRELSAFLLSYHTKNYLHDQSLI